MAYIDIDDNDQAPDVEYNIIKGNEVNLVDLKPSPPYVYNILTPATGKNPVELEKNNKFPKKTYTFDVTKCDEIFDLLVTDGQILVPQGAKLPPLEQRKKRGF